MKIERVRCLTAPGVFYVAVDTDQGITGYGECSHMHNEAVEVLVGTTIEPTIKGMRIHDLEAIEEAVMKRHYKYSGQLLAMAFSGVEVGIWDARGKALGLPIHDLMGGRYRDSVRLYGSSLSRHLSNDEEARKLRAAIEDYGFGAVKFKVGPRMGSGKSVDVIEDARKVRAMREVVGPDIRLMVDANGSYNIAQAIEFCRRISEYQVYHLEEPLPYSDVESYKRLADAIDIPIHVGEQDWNLYAFRDFVAGRACHYYAVDPIKCGGMSNARRAAVLCRAFGVTFAPHNTSRGLGLAAVLQLAASLPEYEYYVEYNLDANPVKEDCLKETVRVAEGRCAVPAGAGLGLDVDEARFLTLT